MLERSKKEICGQHHSFIYPNKDRGRSIEQFKESIKSGKITLEDDLILTKSGNELPVQITPSSIELQNQIIIQVVIKDISARKKWENKIRESENRYKNVFESSNVGIALSTFDSRILEVNDACRKILGYTNSEFINMNAETVFVYRSDGKKILENIKQEGQISNYETQINTKDKSYKWINISSRKIKLNNEDLILTIFTDISEKKRLEYELKQSQELYQDLYENAPDMYCSVHADTAKIITCNQTLATRLGYTKKEIIGQPIYNLYHSSVVSKAKLLFQQFKKTGIISNEELIVQRKDGTKIDVSLNVTSIKNESGEIIFSRSAWRDITEIKLVEQAAVQSNIRY
ncbi:MAG: PAS domain S-box protein, partial [Candidatus Heimdallarchaeota archaeon]